MFKLATFNLVGIKVMVEARKKTASCCILCWKIFKHHQFVMSRIESKSVILLTFTCWKGVRVGLCIHKTTAYRQNPIWNHDHER